MPVIQTELHTITLSAQYSPIVYNHLTFRRFTPLNELIFSKYVKTLPDKLSHVELWDVTEGQRDAWDVFGW